MIAIEICSPDVKHNAVVATVIQRALNDYGLRSTLNSAEGPLGDVRVAAEMQAIVADKIYVEINHKYAPDVPSFIKGASLL